MKDLFTVMQFTIKDMIRRKSFIISNLIILLIIIIGFNIPNIIKSFSGNSDEGWNTKILITDEEKIFENTLESINQLNLGYEIIEKNEKVTTNEISEKIKQGEIDEAIIITTKEGKINLEYIVENIALIGEVPQDLLNAISTLYTNIQLTKYNLTQEQLSSVFPEYNFEIKQSEEEEVHGNVGVMMILSLVLFYAIYFCAYQVSSSITTEKTSKIIETLVTSTEPRTIVLGKTIGIGIVGLLQVVVIGIVALICAKLCLEPEMLEGIFNMDAITPMFVIITLVYFLLGYSLFALLYALTGSTVSKPEDIQSANSPIAILSLIGFYLAYFTMMNPTSDLNTLASIIPISSPFCMPFRIILGTAKTGEIIASLVILVLTILLIAKVSIKIYSNAILNTGTKLSFKNLFKMYKQK